MATYDLLIQPWIPCAFPGERMPRPLSLRSVLAQAHEIDELAVQSPLVYAALHRLLLAVLHRSLHGPANYKEWAKLWRRGRFDVVVLDRYFREVGGRFDLFHPVFPWYQTGNMPAAYRSKPVRALGHQYLAFGATAMVHINVADRHRQPSGDIDPGTTISPAHAALLLATFGTFCLGGLLSRMPGESQSARGGPLTKSAVCIIKGRNLFQTLMLNLCPTYEYQVTDRPAWERGGTSNGQRIPDGQVDWLTWQPRRVCLLPEFEGGKLRVRYVQIAQGWDVPPRAWDWETMVAFRPGARPKDDPIPVGVKSGRAAWRDLSALLVQGTATLPPRNLRWLRNLIELGHLPDDHRLVLVVVGVAAKKVKILYWRLASIELPPSCLSHGRLVPEIDTALQLAESVERALRYRLAKLYMGEFATPEMISERAQAIDLNEFWFWLEEPFRRWLVKLPETSEPGPEWIEILTRIAWRSFYGHTCWVTSVMARAIAEAGFGRAMRAITNPHPTTEEEASA